MEGLITPEEVWHDAKEAYAASLFTRAWTGDADKAASSVIRTAMEAYAAEKVADVLAACPAATSMHGCPSYRQEPRHD